MRPLTSYLRCILMAIAMLAAGRAASADLAVGATAPAFELQDLDGNRVALADFEGRTVVLEWINPNCPVSRGYAEKKTMITTAAAHPEAIWLAINSTHPAHRDFLQPAQHKSYDEKHSIGYPVLVDSSGEVGRAYGAKTTPHMFVIDGTGKLVYNGAIDSGPGATSTNYVETALTALAAGRKPDPSTTKPMGCSVKY